MLYLVVPALFAAGMLNEDQRSRAVGEDPAEKRQLRVMKATDAPGMPSGSAARQGVPTKAAWKVFIIALGTWLRVVDDLLAGLVADTSGGWGSTNPRWYSQAGEGASKSPGLFNILVNKCGMPLVLQAVVDAAAYAKEDGIDVL